MRPKVVEPALGEDSFSCPHCGALAAQNWYKLFSERYEKDLRPWFPRGDILERVQADTNIPEEKKRALAKHFERILAKEVFADNREQACYSNAEIHNLTLSYCFSCKKLAVWHADRLVHPMQPFSIEPNADMPDDVRLDFEEAASIVDVSPRGAAALLRLSVQKLMPHLGMKGKHIDTDIRELVANGLDKRIQQALDVVRVIGNNAVHPGQIDLQDDKATASKLFGLVNLIVEAVITTPKHIEEMYGDLPPGALKAIEKRDGKGD